MKLKLTDVYVPQNLVVKFRQMVYSPNETASVLYYHHIAFSFTFQNIFHMFLFKLYVVFFSLKLPILMFINMNTIFDSSSNEMNANSFFFSKVKAFTEQTTMLKWP